MADRRNETTTICGTDLHILKGDVPAVEDGRILGHERVGTIIEVGSAVTGLTIGDRAVDVDRSRVEQAKRFGATDSAVSTDPDWKDQVMALTDGLGVDVAIEAVGIPETFATVPGIVRPAGHVANAGVHGKGVDLPLDKLWISNITITTGLVNTNTTGTLLKLVAQKKLPVDQFVSHAFELHDIEKAYDTFSRTADTKALKVMLPA